MHIHKAVPLTEGALAEGSLSPAMSTSDRPTGQSDTPVQYFT